MNETAQSLIAYCREHERVCPLPTRWVQLWELLPDRVQVGAGWQPALPLILGGWHHSSDDSKKMRLSEHIEWAERHDGLAAVAAFLRNLAETDWHHLSPEYPSRWDRLRQRAKSNQ